MAESNLGDQGISRLRDGDGEAERAAVMARASMTIEEMFAEIEGDMSENIPKGTEDCEVTSISIVLKGHHERRELDMHILSEELCRVSGTERQLQVMRNLQSLIGRQELRKALFPTIEELVGEMASDPEETSYDLFDENVTRALTLLAAKNTSGSLTKESLLEVLNMLPKRIHKKALLLWMSERMQTEYLELTR